ncbi:hypothetical protein AXI59_02095 [Bacillus nakamurai]|uniref:DUF2971 domain-containing protein n=1 Tax=Bacillus nakamurai TaxID=1793963 RepID=A0A150F3L0_9BACI|nr:DUF2971 domain-containing protein [Bacillus nakamurai]KXZ15312.1 hypothetical protein AXI58_03375 [Bacillus nakamurai]KXZ16698.1 hypothetical protein AXI59_02095 [Bacillus nakamurai]MED1226907.1 DUF2971 domain-containing protein [Bacillus nakamurai]
MDFRDMMAEKYLNEEKKECTLYHYTNIYGLEGILDNREFWVSHSDFLNDKTELKYTLEICESLLQDKLKYNELKDKILDKFDTVLKLMNDHLIYILSLSNNGDSNLLWSNYSNNDGYNIAFSFRAIIDDFEFNQSYSDYYLYHSSVIYEKEHQIKAISEVIDYFIELAEKDILFDRINDDYIVGVADIIRTIQLFSIFFKDNCFSQEEEYRIAIVPYLSKKIQYDCRISNGTFIPFIKLGFHKNRVKGITIGPKNNMDITLEGLVQFLNLHEYNHISKDSIRYSCIPYRY